MKLSVGCRRMSSLAVASPTIPAPTMATSYVLKDKGEVRWQGLGWSLIPGVDKQVHMLQKVRGSMSKCTCLYEQPVDLWNLSVGEPTTPELYSSREAVCICKENIWLSHKATLSKFIYKPNLHELSSSGWAQSVTAAHPSLRWNKCNDPEEHNVPERAF